MADNRYLGKNTNYENNYSKEILEFIPRKQIILEAGKDLRSVSDGYDIWNCYELSWLDPNGKPKVAILQIIYSSKTMKIVESKSLKIYLNSFNFLKFKSVEILKNMIKKDLSEGLETDIIDVYLYDLKNKFYIINKILNKFVPLDKIKTPISQYTTDSSLLVTLDCPTVNERLYSNLLRSNCPVTGQPDWGSIFISYTGRKKIDKVSLLKYIVSFRNHNDFHETTADKIFSDLYQILKPYRLEVMCNYTRRGGIDINPVRISGSDAFINRHLKKKKRLGRLARQ